MKLPHTVVEALAPGVFEVEFCDNDGRTYASLALGADQLMVLHYRPLQVAWEVSLYGLTAEAEVAG